LKSYDIKTIMAFQIETSEPAGRAGPFPLPQAVQELLAPHFPDFDLRRVRIHHGIPPHIRLFAVIIPSAYTSGYDLHFAPGAYDTDSIEGLALIAHEIAHSIQYERHGKVRFQLLYLLHYVANKRKAMSDLHAYEEIPFEREARAKEQEVLERLRAATPACPHRT
jgi:hypothetical protein